MKKYYLAALFMAVALVGASTPAAAQSKDSGKAPDKEGSPASFVLTSPKNGEVLRGGQEIQITWDLTLDKEITEHPFGEMEFFLDTAEGVHLRITPQLSLKARTFNWTVPNISTKTARLSLQCGIEGEGDRFRFFQTGTFVIQALRRGPAIMLNAMPEAAKAGDEMEISWTANLDGYTSYDVMVSYDRGAHFHKAGTTTETRYALKVDEDFAGSITVQIVSRRTDGTKVRSLVNRDATIRVGDKEDR